MTEIPEVVCLKRKKGVVVQDCDVYIGRRLTMGGWKLPSSEWQNPFSLKQYDNNREKVLELYREYIESRPDLIAKLSTLSGKKLGCWCHPNPCHGDILIELFKKYVLTVDKMEINPKIEKCYQKLGLTVEKIKDIFYKGKYQMKTKDTCVYYVPENYKPQDYVFAVDLDNTLTYNEQSLYIKHPDDIKLLPNRLETLQKIFKMGYTIAVFTNQATMKEPDVMKRMKNFLQLVNLPVFVFASVKKDNYRKPEIGMWNLFLNLSKIIPKKVYFSGDALGREVDFSDSDRKFAEKIKSSILVPEEVFGEFDPETIPKNKNSKELVIFVGAPGSNKTTLYRQHYSDYVHVSKDIQKTREMKVFFTALKENKNIVVDDTNPTKAIRAQFIEPAKNLGYSIVLVYFVRAGHNYNDKRVEKVPDVVYHTFFKKLEPPDNEEGDTYIVY